MTDIGIFSSFSDNFLGKRNTELCRMSISEMLPVLSSYTVSLTPSVSRMFGTHLFSDRVDNSDQMYRDLYERVLRIRDCENINAVLLGNKLDLEVDREVRSLWNILL
jgi:hypothetical protein